MQAYERTKIMLAGPHATGIVVSLVFGIVVVLTFYLIQWMIPNRLLYYNEIVTIIFIFVSVLILFPARETIVKRLFKRQIYESVIGSELHHLDFIARQFQWDAMIYEIFPHLLTFIRVNSGRLAILDPDRKVYYFFIYRRGSIHKRNSSHFNLLKSLHKHIKVHRGPLYFSDDHLPEDVVLFMKKFNATEIHPIIYRKSPVGFLLLQETPRHKHSARALDFFCRKAAVSIHNHHLSAKLVDSHLYERELQEARKIRGFLQKNILTGIPGYLIRTISSEGILYNGDLFRGSNGPELYLPVVVCTPQLNAAAGIVLSEVIGRLFSLSRRDQGIHLHKLINEIRKDNVEETTEYKLDYLVGELDAKSGNLIVITEGNFNLMTPNAETKNQGSQTSIRSVYTIQEGESFSFEYHGKKILEIYRMPSDGEEGSPG